MPLSGIRRVWWLPKCFLFVFRLFPGTTRTLMSIPSCDPACHCCSCWEWNKYNTSLLYGRNERQRLRHIRYLAKQKKCDLFFCFFALCCTALWINNRSEQRLHCTSPGERHSYCTLQGIGPPELQCRPEPLNVAVMDQFYKHVLSYFYLYNEFSWFYFLLFW